MTSVNVDTTQSDKLLRLLDTVVIKLEGGTDEDLKVLDEKPIEHRPLEPLKETIAPVIAPPAEPKPAIVASSTKVGDEDDDVQPTAEPEVTEPPTKTNDAVEVEVEVNASTTTKRTTSGSSSSSHSSSSSSSSDDDDSHDGDEEENR